MLGAGIKTTDSTCFFAVESLWNPKSESGPDPEAIAIAASLFDAIVNASELHLCLALSKDEPIPKRLAPSFVYVTEGGPQAKCRHTLKTVVSSTPNDIFGETQRDYVQAALESFMRQLHDRRGLYDMLLQWLRANTSVGADKRRPVFSMPLDYLMEYKPFSHFAEQHTELKWEQWAYCFDFLMKHESYCRRSTGLYLPHTLRSLLGLQMMADAHANNVEQFETVGVNIAISFREAIIPRLKAGAFTSPEHFFDVALDTRQQVEIAQLHDLPFADRTLAAERIAENCGSFFPRISAIERNNPLARFYEDIRQVPKEAVVDFIAIKVLCHFTPVLETRTGRQLLELAAHVVENPHFKELLVEIAATTVVYASRKIGPIVVPLAEHLLLKAERFVYSPTGLAFRVRMGNWEDTKTCAANTDFIRIGRESFIPEAVRPVLAQLT